MCVQLLENKCIICGDIFVLKSKRHPNQKHCSNKCIKASYALRHPEKNKESKQKWIDLHPEKRKEASRKYQQENKEYYTQYSSLRARYMIHAKPKWVDEEKLLEFYKLAKELGLEVDHIIPIKHDLVCGLHVPWNLQLLTRSENAKKSNKFCQGELQ